MTTTQPADQETTPTKHGTYAGAMQHARRKEPMCDPCRLARNTYVRNWRAKSAVADASFLRHSLARSQALGALLRRHQAEYSELLAEALREGAA